MLPIDIPLALALGAALALIAGRGIWFERSGLQSRPFGIAFLWLAVAFYPANRSFFYAYPDWQWMYLVRAADVHFAWMFLYDVGFFAAFALGFLVSHEAVRSGRPAAAYIFLGVVAAAIGAFLVAHRDRLLRVGTYDEFFAGTGRDLHASGLIPWLVAAGAVVLGTMGMAIRGMRRQTGV
ncbi:MAG TPA: hypothetical protein VGA20_00175 [Gemmatimonadales bacterium]